MSSKLSHQSTQSVTAQEGFRNPHLLQELRAEWGIAVDAPLIVIGRLREHTLSGGGSIFFLEDLENSVSGVGLTYPMRNEHMQTKAYVPHSEVSRVRRNKSLSGSDWAIAELQLSPAEEREKRSNPHECRVKQGTLGLLQDVPDQWNLTITGPVSAQRITAAAREAIKGQVRKIEGQVREESIRLDEIVNLARVKKDTEEQKLELVRKAIRSEQLHLEDINQQFLRETQLMENRFRRLNALMAEKGQRLVALDLIDEDDLQGLMPEANSPDERPEIDFHGALDGDLARLAPFVQARLWKRGMLFSKAQLRDFLALLRTHDLLVLAGDSGSGKTSLIRAVAESIGGHCTVVPVKPNWTGPEDLLGYDLRP